MNFAEAVKREASVTRTENGMLAHNTSGDALVDLYGSIGALRDADKTRICRLFAEAYNADPLSATKIVFYARDIREGLGERETFKTLLKEMATRYPETLENNLDLVGVYGRYDDLYALIGTPLEDKMWDAMKAQFEEDRKNMAEGKATSLLAKWIKTADASSKKTAELGCLTAKKLGYSVYEFKRIVRDLRREIGVIESLMSTGKWDEIKYSEVPSRAMKIYRNAFQKHDEKRFEQYSNKAVKGEVKINSSALYPYDIIEQYMGTSAHINSYIKNEDILEAQWRQLPDYVEKGTNILFIADTSGSMFYNSKGRPAHSALGLAIYFAERNTGAYKDLFLTFSGEPHYQHLKGNTLRQKLSSINYSDWEANTDIEKALEKILQTAKQNHINPEEMPKALGITSDLEFDRPKHGITSGGDYQYRDAYSENCKDWSFYGAMKQKFREAGYECPSIIFWNVHSRNDIFHGDANREGLILVSGQSVTVFKQLVQSLDKTAREAMMEVLNSERYAPITLSNQKELDKIEDKTEDDLGLEEIEM